MFSSYLTEFNLVIAGLAAAYVGGVLTAQRVKDFVAGVPSGARSALKNVEADILLKLKTAEEDVLAKLPGASSKVAVPAKTPLAPIAVRAPQAAPAPVAPPAEAPAAAPAAPTT